MPPLDYQVFLTRNSEYHLQSQVCVGVRDRRTGRWLEQHPALSRPLATAIRTGEQFSALQTPQLGESLEFDLDGAPLRTSPVLNIERRTRRVAASGDTSEVLRSAQRPVARGRRRSEDPRVTR